jgi:hypothetical protein
MIDNENLNGKLGASDLTAGNRKTLAIVGRSGDITDTSFARIY